MKKMKKILLGILLLSVIMLTGTIGTIHTKVNAATSITVSVKHPALDTIKLNWNAVSGADGYNVYASIDNGQSYQHAASVSNTSVVFDNLTRDKVYRFKIIAYKYSDGQQLEFLSSEEVISNSNRIGIDVSRWQGDINWAKVKASGIEFAMIRASASTFYNGTYTLYKDKEFTTNIKNAIANNVPVGVYHYSKATTISQAKKDANYILSLIKGYKITYPVVIDIEDDVQKKLSKTTNTNIVNAFCETIKASGYTPMVYSYCSFSKDNMNINAIPYDRWIAHWVTDGSIANNYYHFKSEPNHYPYTRMWQYSTCNIPVPGIYGDVDHNYEFDVKESVIGCTHIDMKTAEITYMAAATDTLATVVEKNLITETSLLTMNPGINSSTILTGKTLKIGRATFGTPVLKVANYKCGSARLNWDLILGADGYSIQRSTSKDGVYTNVLTTDAMTNSYIDNSVTFGQTYYYRIVATAKDETSTKTVSSSKVIYKHVVPTVTTLRAANQNYHTVKLTWGKVTGATGYVVKYATSKTGKYTTLATVTTNTYTKSGLTPGQTYYFKVITKYVDKVGTHYSAEPIVSAKPVLSKVTSLKVSASTYNSVSLSWNKTTDAQLYYVYRSVKSGSGYKKIATTTSITYKNSRLNTGTTYYYKVVGVRKISGKYYTSDMSSLVKAKPSLKKTSVTKLTAGTGKLTLTYNKVSGASGYQIYRATSKKGTYKRVATTKNTTYTNKSLSRNKTYYYKVRAYRVVNGKKVYGSFSSIVYKKTK